ncbi:hypothetical protein VNI00_009642 [Paramarasmius palmivorus]|uniref:Uncharacterized protein n=1 Tax=Paramarasmius palmivorus TaxID=297713 RepID=A0AAW0CS17_9AGAR
MSNLVNKIKEKVSHNNSGSGQNNTNPEPTYSIQPHPNKPNDPTENTQFSDGKAGVFNARGGPYVPSQEIRNNMEQPLGREELRARQAELNRRS